MTGLTRQVRTSSAHGETTQVLQQAPLLALSKLYRTNKWYAK